MLCGRQVIVVVPAYQEEAHVGLVIQTMPRFVDQIVVVDDGSGDRTSDVVRALHEPRAHLVRHHERRGVGAAIATGYERAIGLTSHACDAIAVMAGDAQMAPADLEGVVGPVVRGEAAYVKGCRFGQPGVKRTMGLPRWLGGQAFSRLTSLAIGQEISDSQCGYTALSREAAEELDLSGLWPSFGYPNDLLGQLAARRARIVEVPVQAVYGTEISKLRLRHLPPIFFLIARAAVRRSTASPPRPRDIRRNVTRADDARQKGLRPDSAVSS